MQLRWRREGEAWGREMATGLDLVKQPTPGPKQGSFTLYHGQERYRIVPAGVSEPGSQLIRPRVSNVSLRLKKLKRVVYAG